MLRQHLLVQLVPGLEGDINNWYCGMMYGQHSPKGNTRHHEDSTGRLYEHHWNTKGADEFMSVGVEDLRQVLERGQ